MVAAAAAVVVVVVEEEGEAQLKAASTAINGHDPKKTAKMLL